MSFFNSIVNKIAGRLKKAQGIGQDVNQETGYGYESQDEIIDRIDNAQPQVQPQPQMGSFSDVQIQMIVARARKFLDLVDTVDPLESVLPAFPQYFKNDPLKGYFIQTAYNVLGGKGISQDIIDELLGYWYGTPQEVEPQEVEPQEVEPQEVEPQEVERIKIKRPPDSRMTEEIKRKLSNSDIEERLRSSKEVNPDLCFKGIEQLDSRLGDLYTIGEKKKGTGNMDRYPITWTPPEAQEVIDSYFKDERIDTSALVTKVTRSVKNFLHKKQLKHQVQDADIDSWVWQSMNTPDSLNLSRTQRFNPQNGSTLCVGGGDYLVNFFRKNPTYLPEGISAEYAEANAKEWDFRVKLAPIMSSLISDKNRDVLDYVFNGMGTLIGNLIIDSVPKNQLSYDVESGTGKTYKDILDAKKDKVGDRGAVPDKRNPEVGEMVNDREWEMLKAFAPPVEDYAGYPDQDGKGNILREVYNDLGHSASDSMTDDIVEMNQGTPKGKQNVIKMNRRADLLQIFMLYGTNQIEDIVKPMSELFNPHGKIHLDFKENKVKSWGSLISPGSFLNTFINVAKAKEMIATDFPAGGLSVSNNESTIGTKVSDHFKRQGIEDPVLYNMLADENFIRRSRFIDLGVETTSTTKKPVTENMFSLEYGYFDRDLNLKQHEAMGTKIRGQQAYDLQNIVPYLLQSAIDKERDILANSEDPQAALERFRFGRKFLARAYPRHSAMESTEEGRHVGGRRNDILSRMIGRDMTPREAWWMATGRIDIPLDEIKMSREEAVIEKKNSPPRKRKKKASEQFINGLYKSGNSILVELVKSQQMLDGFGLGEDVIKTINKVGDDYRNRIESLRD